MAKIIISGTYLHTIITDPIIVAILFQRIFVLKGKLSFIVFKSDVHKVTNFYVAKFF